MGFEYSAARGASNAVMGQPISRNGGTVTLRVRVPGTETTTTRIFRRTQRILSTRQKNVVLPAPISGAYRAGVDVERRGQLVPWIISNPIYVR